jgi:hypothetical protein
VAAPTIRAPRSSIEAKKSKEEVETNTMGGSPGLEVDGIGRNPRVNAGATLSCRRRRRRRLRAETAGRRAAVRLAGSRGVRGAARRLASPFMGLRAGQARRRQPWPGRFGLWLADGPSRARGWAVAGGRGRTGSGLRARPVRNRIGFPFFHFLKSFPVQKQIP